VAYRAEIEIGVKGTEKLRELRNTVDLLAAKIDTLDSLADLFDAPIQSLKNYNRTLRTTAQALEKVEIGQKDEAEAIRQYVQALGQANSARARQNDLIQQEIALQEAAKRKIQPGPTGFSRSQFGPALPPAFVKQQENQQNFKALFEELNETAKAISVSNTNTRTSWQKTFEELNETAKAIAVNRLNTQTSWGETFKQLNETAKAISVSRLNTQTSWQKTFEELNETAKAIAVGRLNTQSSWQQTFKELNETAKAISVSRLNTQTSWQKALSELKETSNVINLGRLEVQNSWKQAFKQLDETAELIRQNSARVALREQRRSIRVKEAISKGRSGRIQRERSAFLLGAEQPGGPQGPLRGPGGTGFRVALPLTRAEQKALEISKKRLEVVNRTKRTLKELSGSNEKLAAVTRKGITDQKRINGQIRQRLGLRGALQKLDNQAKVAIADANRQQKSLNDQKREQLKIQENILATQKKIAKSSPIRGTETTPGSPKFLEARARRRRDAASNALIGGAFPLLFGQGAGASVGGALGGGLGGLAGGQFGFGASLVGTALGQAVDQIVAQAQEAGKAFNSTGTALDFVREKSLFSTEQTEIRAAQLEELGRVEELANLLTSELVNVIGNSGVNALQELGKTTDETTKLWNELTLQLSALIAGPLNGFLSVVNELLGRVTTDLRFKSVLKDLSPEQRKKAEAEFLQLTTRGVSGRSGARIQQERGISNQNAQKQIIEKFSKLVPQTADVPVTAEDRKRFAVKSGAGSRKRLDDASRAAAELARLEAQITSEKVRQIDLDIRKSRITLGEAELINKQNQSNKERLELTVQTINKQRSQALARNKFKQNEEAINTLYDSRVKTATDQAEISKQENNRRLELLNIEREISNERRKRQFEQQLQGVNRDIERSRIQLQSPFGGEEQQRQSLLLDQRFRREDLAQSSAEKIRNINDEIAKLGKDDEKGRERLEQRIAQEKQYQAILQGRLLVQDQIEQQQLRQNQLIEKFGFISDEVATAVSSSIQAIVTGTGSIEEAFSTLFQNIGRAFIDLATQVLAQKAFLAVLNALNPGGSLFGGSSGFNLGGFGSLKPDAGSGASGFLTGVDFFANGGRPPVNRPSIVGERGPELFVPGTQGTIIPNEALARPRSATGSRASTQTVNVNYSVTQINGMNFVTESQFRDGLDQAAKRGANMGRTMTISTLKNSRSQRSKLGL
jgi:hypothetical protein